ncbi:hypothetical protein [Chitinophaga vietnamensis]|uniref:hypothetical protein n=1 Tax=Chitinophaga vietnamensis TaxID=2593957 RepID=UPI0011783143|nr:hypothetical protein [Chitinophaga vietnamensis]
MQHFRVWLALAVLGFTSCHSNSSTNGNEQTKAEDALKPATPAGSVQVSIGNRDKDTQDITIKFVLEGKDKEKSFSQPVLKEVSDSEVYRVLWDKPNSCYIGVLKPNHSVRYYHASQDSASKDLKILWATAPPERIWSYIENTMGLGKISSAAALSNEYKKNFQSGNIIADFIVQLKPDSTAADKVELYVEFGGVRKSMYLPVPAGYKPTVQPTSSQDHVYVSMAKDGKLEAVMDLKVENGRLKIEHLKDIK